MSQSKTARASVAATFRHGVVPLHPRVPTGAGRTSGAGARPTIRCYGRVVGGFYGSIQFRADDSEGVLAIVREIANGSSDRFLCGPPLNGWVGVYPSGNGQDERIVRACAGKWSGELF